MAKKVYKYNYNKKCVICSDDYVTTSINSTCCSPACSKVALSHKKGTRSWTDDQVELAKKLRSEGFKSSEIMSQLGMTRSVMFKMFKECNIGLSDKNKQKLVASRWENYNPIEGDKKKCSRCDEFLPLNKFYKSKNKFTGLTDRCIECLKEVYISNVDIVKKRNTEYKKSHPDKYKQHYHNYYLKNQKAVVEKAKLWAINNPEKHKKNRRKSQKKHQKEKNARTAAYRASKKQAVPKWADLKQINEFFKNCPKGYCVDHIYPIRSDFICGLHVIENLRYIPELENESKSNIIIDPDFKVGTCHQYKIRQSTIKEDQKAGFNFDLKCKDFVLQQEEFTPEHRMFIEKYEWLGTVGYTPKWVFTARHNGSLAGVVLIGQPTANVANIDITIQAQITRGACASWAPKHLNSKLVMFAVNWCAKNTEKKVFFAYSDHEAGEIGTIYQACNFDYLGATFGGHNVYLDKNGRKRSARSFKNTSAFKKYAKEMLIKLDTDWFKANGYLNKNKIPKELLDLFNYKASLAIGDCKVVPARPKGKYVIVLGKDKKETFKLKLSIKFTKMEYPKR